MEAAFQDLTSEPYAPVMFLILFFGASALMIWRLESLSGNGVEGTVLGTLVMPYCSGIGNLIFAVVLGRSSGDGKEVMVNCLVNNVTNMTLLIGLPAVIWGMAVIPQKKGRTSKKVIEGYKLNRLELLLSLIAVLFFTGVTWALARDGQLNRSDGLVLIALFLFWQCFHVFEVLKKKVKGGQAIRWMTFIDLGLIGIGAYEIYLSTDWLVHWISTVESGFVSAKHLGWLSGWLMVLPNATLAFYYAWRGRADVTYTSQVGDGHICIPLCVGIFALYRPIEVPAFFEMGMLILCGATIVHMTFVTLFGRLPRWVGLLLAASYGVFVVLGFS